jgi:hypothetical protein
MTMQMQEGAWSLFLAISSFECRFGVGFDWKKLVFVIMVKVKDCRQDDVYAQSICDSVGPAKGNHAECPDPKRIVSAR